MLLKINLSSKKGEFKKQRVSIKPGKIIKFVKKLQLRLEKELKWQTF